MTKKKKINARSKGQRGERQARDFLKSLGFPTTYRTQQYKGTGTNDVTCEELPNLHIEVKHWAKYSYRKLRDAIQQAQRDSKGKPYCVIWRCTHDNLERKTWHISYVFGPNGTVATATSGLKELLERLDHEQGSEV